MVHDPVPQTGDDFGALGGAVITQSLGRIRVDRPTEALESGSLGLVIGSFSGFARKKATCKAAR